ncbi:CSC1-like protein RXW8 [Citrus sinensis]|uniref:CSC1-like protein RXW8 n=1 Tax=Citrus sinensis TaxID=2711 RepID=A0ACB8KEI1_CITSI|nr:CSC1-like protein RXW8 [Citrus sinensis]
MDVSALLTSAGINISVTSLLLSVYSILRKQPSNLSVYFGKRLASVGNRLDDSFSLERFASSSSWIVKAWETSEDEILAIGGMDAVIIIRIIVFRFWVHCLALHVISWSACVLLYFEYKSITRTRLAHITGSPPDPSHFTVLVRAVPWSSEHSYSDSVKQFFMNYYSSSYLSHQIVYRASTVRKLMNDAENMCQLVKNFSTEEKSKLSLLPCLCGKPNSFEVLSDESDSVRENIGFDISDLASEKEYAVAFVYFKTRYAAIVAAEVLHSENPMLWVTELAPEPNDVLWSNLCIPYRQLWFRKIAILLAAIAFMIVFLAPVAFVQGLTRLHQLSHAFPFLKGMFKQKYIKQLVTGYLPSVILILFQYAVPPTMMLFSTVEGSVSHRSIMGQLNAISSVKIILNQLAAAVPIQASFFMTYVLTSGWASLAVEMVQPLGLVYNTMKKCVCRIKEDQPNGFLSFPYHTEVSKLLMFGFLGFICSVMAPLILPLLLIYFVLAYLVYKNQVLTEMDRQDEQGGRMEEIYQQLRSAYCQFRLISQDLCKSGRMDHQGDQNSIRIHSQ